MVADADSNPKDAAGTDDACPAIQRTAWRLFYGRFEFIFMGKCLAFSPGCNFLGR